MKIAEIAAQLQPELVELRRDFHQYPEPSGKEKRTAARIAEELTKHKISVERKAGTGVVGTLTGSQPGPTVALRADIDALSIEEKTGKSYGSKNPGLMHACGHDAHITCLLGAAKILTLIKDKLQGTVKFIFQPAEEICQGAQQMIEAGVLDGVDGIFGIHVWSDVPAGKVNIAAGPRMAATDLFTIEVEGKGGHGSAPHQGVDAVLVAAAVTMNLQTIVSREFNPLEPVVVHVGEMLAGDRFNIIGSKATLRGTNRYFNPEISNKLPEAMKRIAENTAATFRAQADVEYRFGCPPTINDKRIANIVQQAAVKLYGEDCLSPMAPRTAGEDFAYYLEKVPGALAFLGVSNPEKGTIWPQHHPCYDIDEDVLQKGAAIYAQFAWEFLNCR